MQRLSLNENRRRAATTGDGRSTFLTVKNMRRSSPLVDGSMHSGKLNSTQLNWTERPSSVEFSWDQLVQYSTVYWASHAASILSVDNVEQTRTILPKVHREITLISLYVAVVCNTTV